MKRTWHSGPPPHIGWWEASIEEYSYINIWRWWNGRYWSWSSSPDSSLSEVVEAARERSAYDNSEIRWTTYYPRNARVPRVDPRKRK